MSLSSHRSRLVTLARDLSLRWQETRGGWADAKRDEFEKRFIATLFAAADRASHALDPLDEIVQRARKDCE